jgi:hypothetical protein
MQSPFLRILLCRPSNQIDHLRESSESAHLQFFERKFGKFQNLVHVNVIYFPVLQEPFEAQFARQTIHRSKVKNFWVNFNFKSKISHSPQIVVIQVLGVLFLMKLLPGHYEFLGVTRAEAFSFEVTCLNRRPP